ncbi:MAG: carboxypeptidase-like regulatory domain-containing protein [Acidobacteria bacterium]|nr:carboxypeptidase-like regulatory domain-containing protein [Acidobacteriota bacterium]
MRRKMSSPFLRIAALALLIPGALHWLATPAFPQAASGTIRGTVTDPSGAVIPNASVLVTNTQTDVKVRLATNSGGLYEARFLPPGDYTVTVGAAGFEQTIRAHLELHLGQVMGLNVRLKVGQATQSVVVQGGAVQMLQPDTSNVSQVVNHRQVTDLPLNGRNFMDLIALSAGATPGLQGQSIGNYNLNGQRSDQNNFMLEGIDDMNIEGTPTNTPSVDAVQEFQVQTANYSAEFGRAAGGILQVELRSGTNKFHGSVFEFVRNDKLDANGFFNNQVPPNPGETGAPKSELRRNQFGFTLGGPIKKDKLFFFGDYQGSRQVSGDSEIFSVPTLAERDRNFSQTVAPGTPIFQNALLRTVYPGCDLSHFRRPARSSRRAPWTRPPSKSRSSTRPPTFPAILSRGPGLLPITRPTVGPSMTKTASTSKLTITLATRTL